MTSNFKLYYNNEFYNFSDFPKNLYDETYIYMCYVNKNNNILYKTRVFHIEITDEDQIEIHSPYFFLINLKDNTIIKTWNCITFDTSNNKPDNIIVYHDPFAEDSDEIPEKKWIYYICHLNKMTQNFESCDKLYLSIDHHSSFSWYNFDFFSIETCKGEEKIIYDFHRKRKIIQSITLDFDVNTSGLESKDIPYWNPKDFNLPIPKLYIYHLLEIYFLITKIKSLKSKDIQRKVFNLLTDY
jgi:hypothetical protein